MQHGAREPDDDTLGANEALARSLFDSNADCVKVLDLAGRLSAMNRPGLRLMGVDDFAAIAGRHWSLLWPAERRDDVEHALDEARAGRVGRFLGRGPTMKGIDKWWDVQVTPILDEAGRPARLLAISRDVTERATARAVLVESEARFRNMADHAPVMMWVSDIDGNPTYLNRRWHEFTGQSASESAGVGWRAAIHPDDAAGADAALLAADRAQQDYRVEYRVRRADGVYRWMINAASPRRDADGRFLGFVGSLIDIDERKEAEDALRDSEAYVRLLVASTSDAFYAVDREGATTLCNPAFLEILGFAAEGDVLGRKLHDLIHHRHPDGSPYAAADCPLYRCASEGTPADVTGEYFFRADGEAVPVEYRARPIIRDGRLEGAICTFVDVTERRLAETRLADALLAKDALLQEVNHRVKNSLQLVMSLLALQSRQLPDGAEKNGIDDAQSRIAVVAAVHHELYRNDRHGEVELASYLSELVRNSLAAFDAGDRIGFTVDAADPVLIGIDRAVPLALILSEAVTNSLKYGFPDNRPGELRLRIGLPDDGRVAISVHDDGVGLAPGFDPDRSTGLGLRIIKALSRQIRCGYRFEREPSGTSFVVELPLSEARA
ncbi:MAG: PAS domain S-box protein [Janthinobacterium lividum]